MVNICAAVIGDAFKDWVAEQVEERNALMADKREVMIAMDPQMFAKFNASTHVSCKFKLYILLLISDLPDSGQGREREHAQDLFQAS